MQTTSERERNVLVRFLDFKSTPIVPRLLGELHGMGRTQRTDFFLDVLVHINMDSGLY